MEEQQSKENRTKIEKVIGTTGLGIISFFVALFGPALVVCGILAAIIGIHPRNVFWAAFILAFFFKPFVVRFFRMIFERIENKK